MSEPTKRKWTPGPWTIGPNEPSLKSLGKIATYEIGGDASATWNCMVLADEHGEANARLISTAPELLEACKSVLARGCSCHSSTEKDWHHEGNPRTGIPACPIPAVRAAVEKAEFVARTEKLLSEVFG